MIASQKFLVVGAGLIAGAIAIAAVAEAMLWARVRAPSGASGFYLLSPPTLAVSVADGRQLRPGGTDEARPRDEPRR